MPNVFYPQCRATLQIVFETFGAEEGFDPSVIHLRPTSASVYLNSYKEADTFSLEFDARFLPISPELIRGGAVELYMYQTDGVADSAQNVVSDDFENIDGLSPTIVGLIDKVDIEWTGDGHSVNIEGRDYTSLFLDKRWPEVRVTKNTKKTTKASGTKTRTVTKDALGNTIPSGEITGEKVRCGQRLDKCITNIMSEVEGVRDASGQTIITLKVSGDASKLPIVGRGENRNNKRGIPVKSGSTYWDVISLLAARYGFIVFVQGFNVVLTKPKTFIRDKTEVRKLVWGQNLSRIMARRKLGRERVPVIEVRSYDDKSRKTIKGQFPRKGEPAPVVGAGTEKEQVRVFFVAGVTRKEQLDAIAENTYELLARAELTVEIDTRDLEDIEGSSMINVRTGDAIGIKFDPFNNELMEKLSVGERQSVLIQQGYAPQVAATIAEQYANLQQFREPFRLREGTIDWNIDDGISINLELQQFVNVSRSDGERTVNALRGIAGGVEKLAGFFGG